MRFAFRTIPNRKSMGQSGSIGNLESKVLLGITIGNRKLNLREGTYWELSKSTIENRPKILLGTVQKYYWELSKVLLGTV